eukprot:TRINITY_DN19932_c0_g1_i1.p1 TRINITY_DN19932_c0_g1~~TRINITY_DN19932_c0_g1_i1.p1  ORF type:complete len:240 (+),score=20.97 TRINITY_DN19932_c0_g1_i1:188-907(+)
MYPSSCDSTHLPSVSIGNLPCNIACEPGEYLPYGETSCAQCEPGSFSLGGGKRFYNWEELPYDTYEVMGSYCMNSTNDMAITCNGWVPNGSYISADLGNHGDMVILEMIAYLRDTGSVGFEYSAAAEHEGDLLLFEEVGSTPVALPMSAEPTYFNATIEVESPAWVILRWTYYKTSEVSEGEAFAAINYIEVYGIQRANNECSPCPANSYSSASAATCTPCEEGEYSPPGASSCMEMAS